MAENADIRPTNRSIAETIEVVARGCTGNLIEHRIRAFDWYQFRCPGMILNVFLTFLRNKHGWMDGTTVTHHLTPQPIAFSGARAV